MAFLGHFLNFRNGEEAAAGELGLIQVANVHDHQAALIFVWKWLEKRVVDDAENGRGCPDGQREPKYRDACEAAVCEQAAKREAKIADENVQLIFPTRIAAFFFVEFNPAEFSVGPAARLFASHAGSDVIRDLLLDVKLHLGVEMFLRRRFLPQTQ